MACTDNGSSRKLLIILAVLALAAGGISPLALARRASAATVLDWTDSRGPGNGGAPALAWDDTHKILYRAAYGEGQSSGRGVWKYQGGAWTSLGGAVSTYVITSLAYDDMGNKLYAGTNAQGVWCYDPSDGTWSNVAIVEVMTYDITCMAWGGGKLYAGCWDSGESVGLEGKGVWCYDPAATDPKWSSTGGGVTTWRIVSLTWGGNKLYASCHSWPTEALEGVWCYDPSSDSWSDTGGWVSTLYISSFAYDAGHGGLYAGTGSQGVWYADARAAPTVTSVSPNSGVAGTTVSVADLRGTGF